MDLTNSSLSRLFLFFSAGDDLLAFLVVQEFKEIILMLTVKDYSRNGFLSQKENICRWESQPPGFWGKGGVGTKASLG